ncbi:EamA family transporter RarD [Corynebacterium auriscanis]|uniref:EamA family transporter RarD n=1 Tax=Corynebacterium auriscanis TaxID=99807 RepID=UPI003CF96FDF
MVWGVGAYLLWGVFPAFFPLLKPAAPVEILAHRFIWTLVFMSIVVVAVGAMKSMRHISRDQWLKVTLAAVLISLNWGLYIYAVNTNHVADAALGYFINPLVTVMLAVVVLRESLRPMQLVSVAIASVAVIILTVALGQPPIIALGLALSFGLYGLVKKQVKLSPIQSLTAETLVLAPVGLGYIVYLQFQGQNTFVQHGPGHAALLMTAGVVTAVPLLLFSKAAQVLSLTSLGMIQYITPVMQMLWAVFVNQEAIPAARWVGFCIIWVAVIIFIVDMIRHRPPRIRHQRIARGLSQFRRSSCPRHGTSATYR